MAKRCKCCPKVVPFRRGRFQALFLLLIISIAILIIGLTTLSRNGQGNNGKGSRKVHWMDYNRVVLFKEEKKSVYLNREEKSLNEDLLKEHAFHALVSDKISLDRSLPDTRKSGCEAKLYDVDLPSVSVIIIFHNEYLSVLLRTVHSVLNRSPPSLLKEIILVDDCSTKSYLQEPLDSHIKELSDTIRIIRLPERQGLIRTRLVGIRNATGEVIVPMDSHIEVNSGWLPPLLDPIVENPKTCTLPIVDLIACDTFQYSGWQEAERSVGLLMWRSMNWKLHARYNTSGFPTENFPNPVMLGAIFAIRRDFFWELGGFDDQLEIWGGEQFELSFKIWMCGGRMLSVPCSRIGHNYKGCGTHPFMEGEENVRRVYHNLKRVAEVWMDEYKTYLYQPHQAKFDEVELGDLSEQKAMRKMLQCKSFKWYLENVAPEMLYTYPPFHPPSFAHGAIQSLADERFCIDTLERGPRTPVGLYRCAEDKLKPPISEGFQLSHYRDIRNLYDNCFDVSTKKEKAPIVMEECHNNQGNQLFRYDLNSRQIRFETQELRCIEADPTSGHVFMAMCDDKEISQKWRWGTINETMLSDWAQSGTKLL